jgi:hypothetical protein
MGSGELRMKNVELRITLPSIKVILRILPKDLTEYPLRFFAFAQNDRLEFLIREAL